jgi:hypothetical protein
MQKCNEQIDMHFSGRIDKPLTPSEIKSYRDKNKKADEAFQKKAFWVFGVFWVFLTLLTIPVVLELEMTVDNITYYILILLLGFPFVGAILVSGMEGDYIRDRCPKLTWDIKSKSRIAFNAGIDDISDNEYVTLKNMANQNERVMSFVKQIASQERQPIKAEFCMLNNYMDQYPIIHAKQVLGLA